ncbi:uncharacterized protein LOC127243537 isoform X2 [Andrographis paniculata]|uniref:uncharacterized protein LOC127243537 isoform X2 n=1 Tax=Andrographis paniculata TaxID=175694 RepID=UPI0021E70D5E|nr:uncharacterized protein LOC127243537 isoform X2 [Andrographis paniculata]
MVGVLFRFGSVAAWVFHIIACMGRCLGCDEAKLTSSYQETPKGQNNHLVETSELALYDDSWDADPCEIDNNTRSSSLIRMLIPVHDAHCSTTPPKFVNHGLLLWNQTRQKWLECKRPRRLSQPVLDPKLSWNAIYDGVLSYKPFLQPVPLSEMVDFLVNVWEQEGLYD